MGVTSGTADVIKLISVVLVLYTLFCLQTKAIVEFTKTNYLLRAYNREIGHYLKYCRRRF